jgi:TRAP transporter TAXI family solute receptor
MVQWSLVVVALLVGTTTGWSTEKMGIVTGGEKGTYYQFGLDLQKLVKQADINLAVSPSKGSIENVYAVYQRPGVQLGIVQSDVLAFISRLESDPTLNKIAKKTRMVFPLYNEEVHILGKRGIADFDDLAGKRIAIGREGSGTYLTARVFLQLSELKPAATVLIDTDEALAELKAGRIDAMFYVAGFPVRLLRDGVTDADQLALIPITNKNILELYPQAEIPANTYAWQPAKVPTVAAKAVLVSFDYRFRGSGTATTSASSRRRWRAGSTGSCRTAIRSGSRWT